MKKLTSLFVAILFVFTALNPFIAFCLEKGKYAGKVNQINQESKSFQLIGAEKTWTTTWNEKTDFIFEGKKSTSEQLKEGDQVLVVGIPKEDGSTLEAIIVAWGDLPGKDPKNPPKDPGKEPGEGRQNPTIFGKLANLNLGQKTFDLRTNDPQGNSIVLKVVYREETKFVRDKKLAKPEDFKEDEEVTVGGKINPDTKTMEAYLVVLGKVELPKDPGEGNQPPALTGVLKKLDLERKSFQLITKDKQGKESLFDVVYSKETKFFIEKKPVEASVFKNGDIVTVAGRIDEEKKRIQALVVAKGPADQPSVPPIKWEKDSIIRENFSIFNEESMDVNFKTTINKDITMTLTSSEPWLELKSDQAKISSQKFTVKILGEKLTAWKTNTAVINITVTELPNLNKKIFVSIEAIGNMVIVKIGSNKATVNMKEVLLDAGSIPLLKNGRTYVSIRFMGEIVFNDKAKTSFDTKTQTVYFSLGSKKVELYIGKTYALVDGVKVILDAPPFIEKGRTFVPLRFIGENFDASVSFDAKTQTITIVYPGK